MSNTEWTAVEIGETQYQYAETTDPRVVALIERENERGGGHIDGDAYAPAWYFDTWREELTDAGSTFRDDASEYIMSRLADARQRFRTDRKPWAVVARWLWIFHGTTLAQVKSKIDRTAEVVILNTPTWREHVGITETRLDSFEVCSVTGPGEGYVKQIVAAKTADEARDLHLQRYDDEGRYVTHVERASILDGDIEDWQAALDGDVFGIGYAVNESRRLPDSPIDLSDGGWEIEVVCGGFLGEEYAKVEAIVFSHGSPDLDEMLELEPPFVEHTDHMANTAADGWSN